MDQTTEKPNPYKWTYKWVNIVILAILHSISIYTLFAFPYRQKWKLALTLFVMNYPIGFGVTGGAHRLWTHRAYKATLPLRIILMVMFTMAGLGILFDWIRDHRVHHKHSETDADPHNAKRGFFFSHVGWLLIKKLPVVIEKGRELDLNDIFNDPVVMFNRRHYFWLMGLCFLVPIWALGTVFENSWYWVVAGYLTRYVYLLNVSWLVNSAAHIYGNRPYDKRIGPSESWLASLPGIGEGWHNYHHVFPHDYKAAELPYFYNITTLGIDMFAKIGWAYDLRLTSPEVIKKVVERTGDGSHWKLAK